MKRVLGFIALILMACSSQRDWDNGKGALESYQQERQEEVDSKVNNQFPTAVPATEVPQPF